MEPPSIVKDGWVHVDDLDSSVILYRRISVEEARWVDAACRNVRVVAIVDVKGGVKKTTCAVHTAHGLHRVTGKRVLLGDCDQYHSVRDWYDEAARFGDPWPDDIVVVSASGDNYHHTVIDAVGEHQPHYLVLDTPPNDEAAARRAMLLADVVIIPTGPFHMDIRRLLHALRVGAEVSDLRGRGLDVRALITGTKIGTNIYKAARQYLRDQGLPFFNMPIRDLLQHAQVFGTSLKDLGDYDYVPDELVPLLDAAYQAKGGQDG